MNPGYLRYFHGNYPSPTSKPLQSQTPALALALQECSGGTKKMPCSPEIYQSKIHPTDPFTILGHQNPPHDVLELHKIGSSPVLRLKKCEKASRARLGSVLRYIQKKKMLDIEGSHFSFLSAPLPVPNHLLCPPCNTSHQVGCPLPGNGPSCLRGWLRWCGAAPRPHRGNRTVGRRLGRW